jgi:hypothetical protein
MPNPPPLDIFLSKMCNSLNYYKNQNINLLLDIAGKNIRLKRGREDYFCKKIRSMSLLYLISVLLL